MSLSRLAKELDEMKMCPPAFCSAKPIHGDMRRWSATIIGPPGSPYENGVFKLLLEFPAFYPAVPPRVKYVTKIFHMNVNEDGWIKLDILNRKWSPETSVSRILLAIVSLMTTPNPDDPFDREKSSMYRRHRSRYLEEAKLYTSIYAKGDL